MSNALLHFGTSHSVAYFFIHTFEGGSFGCFAGLAKVDFLDKFPSDFLDPCYDEGSQISFSRPIQLTDSAVFDDDPNAFPEANVPDGFIWPGSTAQQHIMRTQVSDFIVRLVGLHSGTVSRNDDCCWRS